MSYLAKLKKKFYRKIFDFSCRDVLRTPPVELDERSDVAVLSQTYHPDLIMYLVAAKTFAKHIKPALFVIVDDGLLPADRSLIAKHLRNVEFLDRRSVPNLVCPTGGTWERLLSVADLCERYYVIQLDSDTVTVNQPDEVVERISRAEAFTLPTRMGRDFVTVKDASATAHKIKSQHVQIYAEQKLADIDVLKGTRYMRGCSGFAGFPKRAINRTDVEAFSKVMEDTLGEKRWSQWGTEQFTSNYLVSNATSNAVMPFQAYPYWEPGMDLTVAKLIHFIGDNRFTSSKYADVARRAIAAL